MIAPVYCVLGETITLQGYATDFGKRIIAVQFSLDDGKTWTTYDTDGTTSDKQVHWSFSYTPEKCGHYVLKVRSVNEEHEVSPQSADTEFYVN